ncbi:MAG: nuclear transport factor 2 family protein [Candidatus Acidiferrales bacterium]
MRVLVLVAVAVLALPAGAQSAADATSEEAAVVAAVQKFFDSMAARDLEAARAVLLPEGRDHSVREGAEAPIIRSFTNEDFVERLATGTEDWLERMWEPKVLVHGRIAVLWAPYDFHRNGAFSHCGVDAFTLVKTESGWKISGGVYTVETEGCLPSPLGPPAPKE